MILYIQDATLAQLVFDDPLWVTFVERISDGEERWHAIGSVEDVIVLVVAYTYRADVVRIISARPASSQERRIYAEAGG